MRPAPGAATGVPVGLLKSTPPCGLLGCLLKMLRVPKLLEGGVVTGGRNGPSHARGLDVLNSSCIRVASRSIRSSALAGGFTNAAGTRNRLVRNFLAATRSSCFCLSGGCPGWSATIVSSYTPGATSRSMPMSPRHWLEPGMGKSATRPPSAVATGGEPGHVQVTSSLTTSPG